MKILRLIVLTVGLYFSVNPVSRSEDKLLTVLKDELKREMKEFKASQDTVPYFISYRVDDIKTSFGYTSFGSVYSSQTFHNRILTPMVRIGSYQMDNFRELQSGFSSNYSGISLPIDDPTGEATRMLMWNRTNVLYRNAIQKLETIKSDEKVRLGNEDKSDDYTSVSPVKHIETELKFSEVKFDSLEWEKRIKEYSAVFKEYPEILYASAQYSFQTIRKYYVSSEGTEIVQNERYARLYVSGQVMADDGMRLPLSLSYFAFTPDGLTDHETVLKDSRELAEKLIKLRVAPVVDSYSGPAILSAPAAGVFFHEIFGHRIEGQRLKSEKDGQTFKKKIGETVLPKHLSVIMDPTLKQIDGQELNGYYKYDDEGVLAQKVDVVEDGILKDFLMSRTPIEGFPSSNGHGRASPGMDPVTRQSNLVIRTSAPKTQEQLRDILKEEARKQGKEFGYYFAEVSGGFTQTGRFNPNSFNVTPLEVYRIYVDGRPDELVRGVNLIGTPLSMFSQIEDAGDKTGIFTGMCGAESGSIPVTAISPEIFVKMVETQKAAKSNEKQPLLPRPEIVNP